MPIYAYRCEDCGHAQDFLQRMSDPLIAACPSCDSQNFKKQVTAAGFQLKGGGWYVTDFRDGAKKDAKKPADGDTAKSADKSATGEVKSDSKADAGESKSGTGESKSGTGESKSGTGEGKSGASENKTATPATAPAANPAAGSSSSGGASKAA